MTFNVNVIIGSCVAFLIAVTSNYCLNALWTFRSTLSVKRLGYRQFASYVFANGVGLVVNLAALSLTIYLAGRSNHLAGQMIGIVCGMFFNYAIAKHVIFSVKGKVDIRKLI